ncbi:MAG: hypothetical protein JNN22_03780 [Rhodospirillales bacterium]|nr:hypothetical protein [Rhodospirillales bacterium]
MLRHIPAMRIAAALAILLCLIGPAARAEDPKPPSGPVVDDPGAEIFLPRMLVTAIQGGEIKRHYALLIKLRLARKEDVETVKNSMDRLQNAFVYDLNDVAQRGDHFDQERAKKRMLASCAKVLGKSDIVEDIVFERVLERRISG